MAPTVKTAPSAPAATAAALARPLGGALAAFIIATMVVPLGLKNFSEAFEGMEDGTKLVVVLVISAVVGVLAFWLLRELS